MDNPAYSLFHGGENIRPNTSDIDDEEALERHKSVSKMVLHLRLLVIWGIEAFLMKLFTMQIEKGLNDFLGDDLLELDETESSIGHSRMYKHDGHRDRDEPYDDRNPFYGQANINGYNTPYRHNAQIHNNDDSGRLKDALESKTREVDHISGLLMVEKKRNDELEKRFKLSEAEKDRAFMQKQQFHDLLVEQKGRSNELEEDISNLKVSYARVSGIFPSLNFFFFLY